MDKNSTFHHKKIIYRPDKWSWIKDFIRFLNAIEWAERPSSNNLLHIIQFTEGHKISVFDQSPTLSFIFHGI